MTIVGSLDTARKMRHVPRNMVRSLAVGDGRAVPGPQSGGVSVCQRRLNSARIHNDSPARRLPCEAMIQSFSVAR